MNNMKAFEAVYRHGKLYDQETKKRILIKEGAIAILVLQEKYLMNEDPYNKPVKCKNSDDLLAEIEGKKYYSSKKLAGINDKLSFVIKAGKNTDTKSNRIECEFTINLLEDLFLFQKTKETKYGLVYPCACVVESANSLQSFEPIYAYSLNDAYMKTYDFYFALYGKPTANIYDHFWLINGDDKKLLAQLRMYQEI
jgi:hypothetical protein